MLASEERKSTLVGINIHTHTFVREGEMYTRKRMCEERRNTCCGQFRNFKQHLSLAHIANSN
jgi:hypothetical protein